MEALLKSLQIGFILRSLFAGVYFVVAYAFAESGVHAANAILAPTIYSLGLPTAILVGVTVYTWHRSVLYPMVEHVLNSPMAVRLRVRYPLISVNTIAVLRKLWCAGGEGNKSDELIARHVGTWADYTHLQYASAICLALGSLAKAWVDAGHYGISWPLLAGIVALAGAGLFSDWRLHSVREALGFGEEPLKVIAKP